MKTMISFKNYMLTTLSLIVMMVACNEWEEHNKPSREALKENLRQAINKTPELSQFSEYRVATGYDQVLTTSRTFTVWAPDNQALAALSSDITGDPEKLKSFIANHISYQEYF